MKSAIAARWQALACLLVLPLCAILVSPHLESGLADDFAYIRMVRVLAQTGHYAYNGWESPIIGWLAFLGAAFVKVFGFSFTVVRSVNLTLASLAGFLAQRLGVRFSLSERNATLVTLALLLSPLTMPLAFSFMTDIGGLFCLVLCLYLVVRALQAPTGRQTVLFIILTAVASVAGGTGRQTAWLGCVVMIPSLLIILRYRRRVRLAGIITCLVSFAVVFACARWFAHQPYAMAEEPLHQLDHEALKSLSENIVRGVLDLLFFALPVLLIFTSALRPAKRRHTLFFAVGMLGCIAFALLQLHRHKLVLWLPPYLGDWFSITGAYDNAMTHGLRAVILRQRVRLVLAAAMAISITCLIVTWMTAPAMPEIPASTDRKRMPWTELSWLLLPVTAAYFALLVPRALAEKIFDRYMLFPLLIALLLIMRLYQDRVRPKVPAWSFAVVLLGGAYAVATTHDLFSLYRAREQAIHQLQAAKVDPLDIDGSFEYNNTTQIDVAGFVNDRRVILPLGVKRPTFTKEPADLGLCGPYSPELYPSLHPKFAFAFDPKACGGPSSFAPVSYSPWLGPKTVTIYTVREPK